MTYPTPARTTTLPLAPGRIEVEPAVLDDLGDRLARTRWFDAVGSWENGIDIAYVRELAHEWRTAFDWGAWQDRFNAFGQVVTTVDGQRIHAFHQRSDRKSTRLNSSHEVPSRMPSSA